jgi:hypothetical protein
MKKYMIAGLLLVLVFAASICEAQYGYYYYYPGYGTYYSPYPLIGPALPANPQQYRIGPNPRVYRRWNSMNRYEDYQQHLRSPLNPESTIDYMMRTF